MNEQQWLIIATQAPLFGIALGILAHSVWEFFSKGLTLTQMQEIMDKSEQTQLNNDRRVFYIDVGNLNQKQARQLLEHIKERMEK